MSSNTNNTGLHNIYVAGDKLALAVVGFCFLVSLGLAVAYSAWVPALIVGLPTLLICAASTFMLLIIARKTRPLSHASPRPTFMV